MFSAAETSSAAGDPLAALSRTSRSRVTNGSALLPDMDGRSAWARRLRDLIAIHLSDLGGEENLSEATKAIVRRAAVLTVQLERIESGWATKADNDQQPTAAELDLYQRASNSLRRLLESVGLDRKARDVTPSVRDYITDRASRRATATATVRRDAEDVEEVRASASSAAPAPPEAAD